MNNDVKVGNRSSLELLKVENFQVGSSQESEKREEKERGNEERAEVGLTCLTPSVRGKCTVLSDLIGMRGRREKEGKEV